MDKIDKFFLINDLNNLRKRHAKKASNESISVNNDKPMFFNLNVANLGSANKIIERSNFLNHEIFEDNAVFSYRLRDKCIEEINNLFLEKMPKSHKFSLSICFGSSLISNLLALNLRIFYGRKPLLLTSSSEHIGGIEPFTHNADVHTVDLDIDHICNEAINLRPDIIFLSHFSYEKGASINLKILKKKLSKLPKKPLMIIDCAQSLGCEELPFDFADIIFASSHKWLCGPRGLGLVWINKKCEKKIHPLGGDKGAFGSKLSIPGGYDFLSFFELLCSLRIYFENKNTKLINLKNHLRDQLSDIFQVIPSDHKSMLLLTSKNDLLSSYLDLQDKGVSVKYFKNNNYFRLSPPYFYTKHDVDNVVKIIKISMNKKYV
jgi:hypothetical protein